MKAIFIILICVPCLLPILIIGGSGLGQIFNNNCTSNTDCHPFEKCSNNKCIFACEDVSCGSEAYCQMNSNHESLCICGPYLKFDSNGKKCVPECTYDTDCDPSKKCSNNKCIHVCNGVSCGYHGYCTSNNDHTSLCICEAKTKIKSSITACILQCTYDTDCDPLEKCSNNKCIFACDGVSCGRHGHCIFNNDHTSSCICGAKSKFNSSINECVPHCTYDIDCDPFEKCSNNKCISACDGVSCGSEAYCQMNSNHTSSCICGPNLEFDSNWKKCVPHCTYDTDCGLSEKCSNNKCIFACDEVSCGRHGQCIVYSSHKSACVCEPKLKFNKTIGDCTPHCTSNTDCDPSEKCSNNKCISACDGVSCGRHGQCLVFNDHKGHCACEPDSDFNGTTRECVPRCTNDTDCVGSEKCSNKKCIHVCNGDPCGHFGYCKPESDHTNRCLCYPGTEFDSSFKECGSYVITNNEASYTFTMIGSYIQFYFKGNETVKILLIQDWLNGKPTLFVMTITDKDIRFEIDQKYFIDELPPSTLSAHEYRGFWFKFDLTTIKFGKMKNDTPIREYDVRRLPFIDFLRLSSTHDTKWFVAGLPPARLNTN